MPEIQPQSTAIETVDQLKQYLQVAIKLEHATIPPYLTTAYTTKQSNSKSREIIIGVAKEEMLHLTLAANLLNAIGGQPNFTSADFVPQYPTHLPTGETTFEVNIERFSLSAVDTFLNIERPASLRPDQENMAQHIIRDISIKADHLNKSTGESANSFIQVHKKEGGDFMMHYDVVMIPHSKLSPKRLAAATKSFIPTVKTTDAQGKEIELHFWSIGEFYKAISYGFVYLCKMLGPDVLFRGNVERQAPADLIFSMGGKGFVITDLKSALAAIDLIAGQGEGNNDRVYDDDGEIAHYYKFDQIKKERCYRDPRKHGHILDTPGDPQGELFPVDFNEVYPIRKNAKAADYHGEQELEENALRFNGLYKQFLERLERGFNGHPEELKPDIFFKRMFDLQRVMERLIHYPMTGTIENAAPTFEMNCFKYPESK